MKKCQSSKIGDLRTHDTRNYCSNNNNNGNVPLNTKNIKTTV
jgi:hypothetical protein